MDRAAHVLVRAMAGCLMLGSKTEIVVARILIGRDEIDVPNNLADEAVNRS